MHILETANKEQLRPCKTQTSNSINTGQVHTKIQTCNGTKTKQQLCAPSHMHH